MSNTSLSILTKTLAIMVHHRPPVAFDIVRLRHSCSSRTSLASEEKAQEIPKRKLQIIHHHHHTPEIVVMLYWN